MAKRKKPLKIRQNSEFAFVISNTWTPMRTSSNSRFMEAVINTASKLLSKESFPIAMDTLKKEAGYKDAHSACSSIRAALLKKVGKHRIGEYSAHIIKNADGVEVAIRIRKK